MSRGRSQLFPRSWWNRQSVPTVRLAAELGHPAQLEMLLNQDHDPNEMRSFDEKTALMLAASNNNKECVELLLSKGASVLRIDKYGDTALILAARQGFDDSVQLLIGSNPTSKHIDVQNSLGNTALMAAVSHNHIGCVQLLCTGENKANVNKQARGGGTALIYAADKGFSDIVGILLKDANLDLNLASDSGWTALMAAAFYGHVGCIQALLKFTVFDWNDITKYNNIRSEKPTLETNTKTQQDQGQTAEELARSHGHEFCAELIKGYDLVTMAANEKFIPENVKAAIADAPEEWQTILNQFIDEHTCGVCLETLDTLGVAFRCGHRFCRKCALGHMLAQSSLEQLSCPNCRHKSTYMRIRARRGTLQHTGSSIHRFVK